MQPIGGSVPFLQLSAAERTRLWPKYSVSGSSRQSLREEFWRGEGFISGAETSQSGCLRSGAAPGHKTTLPAEDETRSREFTPPYPNPRDFSFSLPKFLTTRRVKGKDAGRQSAENERFLFLYWEFAGIPVQEGDAERGGLRGTSGEEL